MIMTTCILIQIDHHATSFIIDKPLEWSEQRRKTFDDDTVKMDITHCGICASDLFTLDSG